MDTTTLLDRAKQRRGLRSDYALAQQLGVPTNYLTQWRKRKGVGDEYALQLAQLAELPAGFVLASLAAERAQSAAARQAWTAVAAELDPAHRSLVITLSRRLAQSAQQIRELPQLFALA